MPLASSCLLSLRRKILLQADLGKTQCLSYRISGACPSSRFGADRPTIRAFSEGSRRLRKSNLATRLKLIAASLAAIIVA